MIHLTVISPEEVEAIHQASLRLLAETGVALSLPEGRQILLDAGATLRQGRVCLPPDLVEKALGTCPPQVSLRGRGGKIKKLGDGSLHWHNLGGARDVYDHHTQTRRPAMSQDVRDS